MNPTTALLRAETPLPRHRRTGHGSLHVDALAQAQSLLDFDRAPISLGLYPLVRNHQRRIILTGMGASHVAALPSWGRLVAGGRSAWWIDTENLLENPQIVTSDSLLIATSRSGSGGPVRALADRLNETMRPAAMVAITDDLASPLAEVADCEVLLRSGASGSPTGFLNALIAHDYVASLILNEDNDDVSPLARTVATTTLPTELREVAADITSHPDSRLAYVGYGKHAAAVLYAALLTNELTSIPADAYVARQHQDDLLQSASAQLTVLLFDSHSAPNLVLHALARDLLAAGSKVIVIGGVDVSGLTYVPSLTEHVGAEVARNVVVIEQFVSALTT
jgi:fructoselysine-6-P-deglycase FrlB-like protein